MLGRTTRWPHSGEQRARRAHIWRPSGGGKPLLRATPGASRRGQKRGWGTLSHRQWRVTGRGMQFNDQIGHGTRWREGSSDVGMSVESGERVPPVTNLGGDVPSRCENELAQISGAFSDF